MSDVTPAPESAPSESTSRRHFMQAALGTGFALTALGATGCATGRNEGPLILGAEKKSGPEVLAPRKPFTDLRIAYIGTGGIGGYHLENTVGEGVQCHCYCDVDTTHWEPAAKAFPKAKGYQDYREMLDNEHANIDAVMVGVPDHHHYPATMLAMHHGKHVYTQKPLTHTVWEARQLAIAAKKYKLATQMGNQGHANEGWRLVYEWIRGGALGQVREAHTWTDRPIWPQGIDRPKEQDAVPATVNWDVWCGPAPARPYKSGAYHPFNWRGWFDFGAGALGDMACHTMDGVFWALEPGSPDWVEPVALCDVNGETFPKAAVIRWHFPKKGNRDAFVAYWYDGGLRPPRPPELEADRRMPNTGNLFIGTKATLLVSGDYGESPTIIPEVKRKEIGKPKQLLDRSPGHVKEWLMACCGEKPIDYPGSNFSYSGPMSETILLGNVSLRAGRRLDWDGSKLQFTNMPEANQWVSKEYREGWRYEV